MATAEKIIAQQSVLVDIDAVKPYRKNPRVGDVQAIRESLRENGQFRPIVVQRSTGEILGGNHTWKAAKAEGWTEIAVCYVDVDDDTAKRIVLVDNRSNDLATYNTDILADILSGLENPVGTGYDQAAYDALVKSVQEQTPPEVLQDIVRPVIPAQQGEGEFEGVGVNAPGAAGMADEWTGPSGQDPEDVEDLRDTLGELQGILQLKEDMQFKSTNYYGIPDLNPAMLLDTLPSPLATWGGPDATPDDGQTTWLWNYGVASKKDLPMDRAILCFYTYDTYFESFWDEPAFMTAKVLNAGIKTAVVPDFSFYTEMSTAEHIYNTYRAQWIGRYFQEAGIKVIPRLQFGIGDGEKTLDFALAGIPKGIPILAQSIQNANKKEEEAQSIANTKKALDLLQPQTWLVYGGTAAQRQIEAVGFTGKVVHLWNYAHVRRGVVYDKKEGLAAKKKDTRRMAKDRTSEPQAPKSIQGEQQAETL